MHFDVLWPEQVDTKRSLFTNNSGQVTQRPCRRAYTEGLFDFPSERPCNTKDLLQSIGVAICAVKLLIDAFENVCRRSPIGHFTLRCIRTRAEDPCRFISRHKSEANVQHGMQQGMQLCSRISAPTWMLQPMTLAWKRRIWRLYSCSVRHKSDCESHIIVILNCKPIYWLRRGGSA